VVVLVLPEHRNAGSGRALLDAATTYADEAGFTPATTLMIRSGRRPPA
jgi:GNAT superfamily N-acetyltransferase